MIWESHYWRRELKRLESEIRIWVDDLHREERDGEANFQTEKALFLSAFSIRKLIESEKIRDEDSSSSIICHTHRSKKNVSNILTPLDADKYYDFSKNEKTTQKGRDIANMLIHSKILEWRIDESEPDNAAFLVTSDRNVDKFIFLISFNSWREYLIRIAHSQPSSMMKFRDPYTGKVTTKLE